MAFTIKKKIPAFLQGFFEHYASKIWSITTKKERERWAKTEVFALYLSRFF